MSAPQKVSFTVRRPTPISRGDSSGPESDSGSSFKVPSLPRHLSSQNDSVPGSPLARSATSSPRPKDKPVAYYDDKDSSDEEEEGMQDELVTGFDRFGVQRLKPKKKPEGPLIIPALKNRDWREVARKRRTATQFVPASGAAQTGADGSVGGLGTRDSINSGPVLIGLQVKAKVEDKDTVMSEIKEEETTEVKMEEQETEDQRALRAILAGVNGNNNGEPSIDIIPTPVSEEDALKQDVADLPDSATLTDYERVPVSQFGAALLRGMGWKEGTAASKKGKGMVEPYLPEARPALLGIGAKEKEALDDGRPKKGGSKRPEKRTGQILQGGAAPGGIRGRLEDTQRGETPTSGAAVATETMIGIATATTGGVLTKTEIAEETAHPTPVEDVEIDTIDDIFLFTVRQR
ncbi:hypothetical protein PC9H_007743 [Pleurotus ostreatus]|uniref:G-patch domain-containing protein n=1 Tax=Pleurotus ostreatus TaxID=5322 RepID=A0A8H6ZUP9_PLEOS|nr:uncharacterized protein PC9H_007743 [Pleurotus ostreatus]KAF7428519.1 hypothetical protein PC9H_007743 [Pleurotus ostreatus]